MREAFEHAALRELDNLTDPRHQPPANAARRCTVGPRRRTRGAPKPTAGPRSRSTGTTSRRSTAPYEEAVASTGRPTVIVARTIKGKGVQGRREPAPGQHGKALDDPEGSIASSAASGTSSSTATLWKATRSRTPSRRAQLAPTYESGNEVATRKAYGDALLRARQGSRTKSYAREKNAANVERERLPAEHLHPDGGRGELLLRDVHLVVPLGKRVGEVSATWSSRPRRRARRRRRGPSPSAASASP